MGKLLAERDTLERIIRECATSFREHCNSCTVTSDAMKNKKKVEDILFNT